MAFNTAIPPRRVAQHTVRPQLSPLTMLLQMGFSLKRAEKALAATGDRSVQLASDWLAARLNDPKLDEDTPREFVLYMRPTGPLSVQIYSFWEEVLETVGRNSAQNLMPHITLCSYFKVDDAHSWRLGEMLVAAASSVLSNTELPLPLPLEKYISQNYMGLFVTSPAAPVLQSIKRHFVQAAASVCPSLAGVTEEDLHLTLAYSYSVSQFPRLEELVQQVAVSAPATWELCLYSREPRFNGLELYRAVRGHDPSHPDELLLLRGDYVFVSGEDMSSAVDDWVHGTSWLTACRGLVPVSCLVRAPDSDAWTLHRGLTICADGKGIEITDGAPVEDCNSALLEPSEGPSTPVCHSNATPESGLSLSLLNLLDHSEGSRRSTTAHSDASSTDRLHSRQPSLDGGHDRLNVQQLDALYAKVNKSHRKQSIALYKFPISGPRKIFVMRHGERADFTFGDWCTACFDEDGQYSRADLNLQVSLPSRSDGPRTFVQDGPLTRVGELQARLVGEGFASTSTPIHHVYCSPSLRCVMTATNVLRGMEIEDRMPLKIEPGLFEWLAWYKDGAPRFMTLEELTAAGYNIDTSYRPVLPVSRLVPDETTDHYYTRSGLVTNSVLAATKHLGGNVLLVGHAASLDTCTRQLVGGHPRTAAGMTGLVKKVSYCSMSAAEEGATDGLWSFVEPPFRSPTHSANHVYDWTIWRQ